MMSCAFKQRAARKKKKDGSMAVSAPESEVRCTSDGGQKVMSQCADAAAQTSHCQLSEGRTVICSALPSRCIFILKRAQKINAAKTEMSCP